METTKRNTKLVGDISESAVINALVKCGYEISTPFGENHRYDLLIDSGATISRVQVKSGRLRNGVVRFAACSTHSYRGGPFSRSYRGQIDYFGVYCRDTDAVYLVPCAEMPPTHGSLRIEPTKQGQSKKIHWASKYVLAERTPALVGVSPGVVVTQGTEPPLLPS